ncbi:hypothetical protein [Nannocystis punicea]|uniref:Uncharacterized protein n=1 Tax=Nannocystis punicea TaxID=2995304 RepID=A0ABY7GUG8_9BACT|nr:hypothetical protein [Nannocystis poenicansa]WAS90611.1 hypothetical protein O0S08_30865 [Nannocystis poenicansa]
MLALTTCAALLLAPAPSPAAGPAMPEVRWEAPPGCPDEAWVRAQIAGLLARAPAGAGQAAQVNLRVEALPSGRWRLDAAISSGAGQGRRSLEGDRCEALAEAAALLTAIAAVPELQQAAPPVQEEAPGTAVPPPGPPAPVEAEGPVGPQAPEIDAGELEPELPGPSATPPPPAETPARAPARRRPAPKATLGLGAGIGAGALPRVTALLRASVGLRGRHWAVALTQSFWLPRDLPAAEDERVGGRMWLAATGLRGCGIVGKGRVEAPLCAGVEVGALRGRGIGDLAASYRATSFWAAATVGPGLHVRVAPRVALTFGADLLVMLTRARFEISGRGQVCCSGAVGASATAGVEVRLP